MANNADPGPLTASERSKLAETETVDTQEIEESTVAHATTAGGGFGRLARLSTLTAAVAVCTSAAAVLIGIGAWQGLQIHSESQDEETTRLFVQAARQGALNLTTIDFQHADADVARVLDSSTGTFRDDFEKRSGPFVDVVKKAKSISVGNITEAGIESRDGATARVLVAINVKTTVNGATDQQPRNWRMRITVDRVGDGAKMSDVQFVP